MLPVGCYNCHSRNTWSLWTQGFRVLKSKYWLLQVGLQSRCEITKSDLTTFKMLLLESDVQTSGSNQKRILNIYIIYLKKKITKPMCRASNNAVLINNTNKLEPNPSQGVLECNIVMVSSSPAHPIPIWGKPQNHGSR